MCHTRSDDGGVPSLVQWRHRRRFLQRDLYSRRRPTPLEEEVTAWLGRDWNSRVASERAEQRNGFGDSTAKSTAGPISLSLDPPVGGWCGAGGGWSGVVEFVARSQTQPSGVGACRVGVGGCGGLVAPGCVFWGARSPWGAS